MSNKNGLEMFAEELEILIQEEERNPSPILPPKSRLWELSIITISLEENLKHLKGYLEEDEEEQFRFIKVLGYIFNLDRLIKDKDTPRNYMPRLSRVLDLNRKMHRELESLDYDSNYKIIEEAFKLSISLWLEEAKTLNLEPLKTLKGKEQEDYMRLLTDLDYRNERHHENMISYFIELVQESNL